MSLERKAIREKVAAILGASPPIQGITKIFENRQRRVAAEECPCILIYTKSESANVEIEAPRQYKRILKLVVEIIRLDVNSQDVDDFMDIAADEIEQRLFLNETLDELASDTLLSDTEIDFVTDSEGEYGFCRLTFDVSYWTNSPRERTDLDNFERYHSEIKVEGSTPDTVPMVDDTELPQV
jgi:hypothetical protein